MAYNTVLADKIREYLVETPNSEIEEKKMFQGLTFIVSGKTKGQSHLSYADLRFRSGCFSA